MDVCPVSIKLNVLKVSPEYIFDGGSGVASIFSHEFLGERTTSKNVLKKLFTQIAFKVEKQIRRMKPCEVIGSLQGSLKSVSRGFIEVSRGQEFPA